MNQDGRSSGFSAPSGQAQQQMLHLALADADLTPDQVTYIEAHGSGTSLGDAIEVNSLAEVFCTSSRAEPLYIGSVKANVGHTEACAGLAGLIKSIYVVRDATVLPQIHVHTVSQAVEQSRLLTPPATQVDLTATPRIAGVRSFGITGSNAHVIIQGLKDEEQRPAASGDRPELSRHHLIVLSARTQQALKKLALKLALATENTPRDLTLDNISYTIIAGRVGHRARAALVARSKDEFRELCTAYGHCDQELSGVIAGAVHTNPARPESMVFCFTGQGSQYLDMGKDLLAFHPDARRVMLQCDAILRHHLPHERSILEIICQDEALLNRTEYAQPAIFVVAYALAMLWMSPGVRPAAVMGHSIGEYVAATIAGALPLETALAIIATRGRMMQALPPGGIMVAGRGTETQAAVAIQELQEPEPSVSIAAVNTANQVVIAGRRDSVEAVVQRLNAKPSPLLTSHAFHSPLMQGVIEGFSAAVGSALSQAEIASSDALDADRNCEAPIRFISTVGTARTVDQDELREAAYWVRHIVSKVDFYGGVQELQRSCHPTVIIEIGPRPVLSRLIQQILPSICSEATERPTVVHSLERGVSAGQALLQSMATLYVNHHIDNQRLQQMLDFQFHDSCLVHDLPFPDYAHKSYWFAATSTAAPGFPSQTPACTSNSPRMQQVELPLAAVPQAPSLNQPSRRVRPRTAMQSRRKRILPSRPDFASSSPWSPR